MLTLKSRKVEQVMPFVFTFHPDLPHLSGILHECQFLIDVHVSPRLKGTLPKPPLGVHRHPPNLGNILVRAALKKSQETYKGNDRCGQPRCKACSLIKTDATFCSSTTNKEFRVKATIDCRTKNVVSRSTVVILT